MFFDIIVISAWHGFSDSSMICILVEAKKGMWFEDLKNVNNEKMIVDIFFIFYDS